MAATGLESRARKEKDMRLLKSVYTKLYDELFVYVKFLKVHNLRLEHSDFCIKVPFRRYQSSMFFYYNMSYSEISYNYAMCSFSAVANTKAQTAYELFNLQKRLCGKVPYQPRFRDSIPPIWTHAVRRLSK